jgi:hypothetical protein
LLTRIIAILIAPAELAAVAPYRATPQSPALTLDDKGLISLAIDIDSHPIALDSSKSLALNPLITALTLPAMESYGSESGY